MYLFLHTLCKLWYKLGGQGEWGGLGANDGWGGVEFFDKGAGWRMWGGDISLFIHHSHSIFIIGLEIEVGHRPR